MSPSPAPGPGPAPRSDQPPVSPPTSPTSPAPPTSPTPPSAADLAARAAALRGGRPRHPAQGARTVALAASVASTVSVALALTLADRPEPTAVSSSSAAVASSSSAAASPSPAASSSATTTAAAARYADGTWTGTAEYTKWGNVQVQATVVGGRLTDVVAVQSPTDRKSANINAQAQPILESEAIAQQDAELDAVSGATYTSRTYTASLQAALDRAAAAVTSAKVQTS